MSDVEDETFTRFAASNNSQGHLNQKSGAGA